MSRFLSVCYPSDFFRQNLHQNLTKVLVTKSPKLAHGAPCATWSLELMSNIAGVEFVGNNLRGRNFCWVKCAKTLTSVVNTN